MTVPKRSDAGEPGSAHSPEALIQQILDGTERTRTNTEKAQSSIEEREADDRSHITRTVMDVLRWGLPAAILLLLLLAVLEPSSSSESIKAGVEIFKAVLLPIMTLVLGYYFGRGGKV